MKTALIKLTEINKEEALSRAAEVIKSGGLVVFPTETVYGLGADATDDEALNKIFEAKGRPRDNPIIVHIASPEELRELTNEVYAIEEELIQNFWPGPLTIIFNKKESVSLVLSGGLETVAVRMPAYPFAREMVLRAGVPVGAPSANTSGRPSGTTGLHVLEDLYGKVDLIIDDGPSDIGVESTVVKVSNDKILILRAGAITKEMIEGALPGHEVVFALDKKDLDASPGTRYRHYAPHAKLEVISSVEEMLQRGELLVDSAEKVGILCTEENKKYFKSYENVFVLGSRNNLSEISKNLYTGLRFFDFREVSYILCESFQKEGIGAAIMDRLNKASSKA